MAHGCACSHFTLITIRPIDERQRRTDALAERPRLRVANTSRGVLRGLHYQLEPEPQGESDEPDAPLLLERELAVWEGDVDIGRHRTKTEQSGQQHCRQTGEKPGFQQGFAVEPQAPPGQWCIQIPRNFLHPKQPDPIPTTTSLVHAYASAHV